MLADSLRFQKPTNAKPDNVVCHQKKIQMKKLLPIIILLIPQILFSGKVGPSRSIAKTYHVGIININDHLCLDEINEELKNDSYNTKSFSKPKDSAWDFAKQNNLDFMIYLNSKNIILLVGKTGYERKFNIEDSHYYCGSIVHTIHGMTVKKSIFDSKNFSFEDLKTEGEKLFRNGEKEEALEYFEEALKLKSEDPDIFYFMSQIYDIKGNDDLEIKYLNKAKALNPIDGKIIIGIGNYHLERKEYNFAIENYSMAMSDPDNKYPATFNLGLIQELKKNNDEAISFYKLIPNDNHLYGKAQRRISEIENNQSSFFKYSIILGIALFALVFSLIFRRRRRNKIKASLNIEKLTLDLIRNEIGRGNIEEAVSKLKSSLTTEDNDLNEIVLQIESRWSQLKRQEMKDIVGGRELQIEKNRITNSLLELIK